MPSSCHELISDEDIRKIYQNSHSMIHSSIIESSCNGVNQKNVSLHIFNDAGDELNACPIERRYYLEQNLVGTTLRGKVVEHYIFILKNEYQKKKISSDVHKNEIKIYKRNSFLQIQLSAMCDGVIVWLKNKYSLVNTQQENDIMTAWKSYLLASDGRNLPVAEYVRLVKSIKQIKDIPTEYLYSEDGTSYISFTAWLFQKSSSPMCIKMYKNVA